MSNGGAPRSVEELDAEIASTVERVRELKRLRYEKTTMQGADFAKLKRDGIRLGMVNRKKNKKRDVAGEVQRTDAAQVAQIREKLDEVKSIDKELNVLRKRLDSLEAEKARLAGKAPLLNQNQRRRAVGKEKKLHSNMKQIAKLVNRIDQQEQHERFGGAGPSSSAQLFDAGHSSQQQPQPKSTAELWDKLERVEARVAGRPLPPMPPRSYNDQPSLPSAHRNYGDFNQLPHTQPSSGGYSSIHQPVHRDRYPLAPSGQYSYEASLHSQASMESYKDRYQPPHPQALPERKRPLYTVSHEALNQHEPLVKYGRHHEPLHLPSLPLGRYDDRFEPSHSRASLESYEGRNQPSHSETMLESYADRHEPPHACAPSGSYDGRYQPALSHASSDRYEPSHLQAPSGRYDHSHLQTLPGSHGGMYQSSHQQAASSGRYGNHHQSLHPHMQPGSYADHSRTPRLTAPSASYAAEQYQPPQEQGKNYNSHHQPPFYGRFY